jgi:RNA polymerase sigma factor (TIGR02999 family)
MRDITQLLHEIDAGDRQASAELLPLVYDELKKLAAAKMAAERPDHTLQATALVHEAYLRLVGSGNEAEWNGRGHFFGAAAEAMRRILVDHARNAGRLKRGGDVQHFSLDAIEQFWQPQYGDILDLHQALEGLEAEAPQAAELVKLCCFAGQSRAEAAALMGITPRTARRQWAYARAWLFQALNSSDSKSY